MGLKHRWISTVWIDTVLLVLASSCIAAGTLLLLAGWRQRRKAAAAAQLLRRSRIQYDEMKLALAQLERLERWQQHTSSGIAGGTAAIRAIHQGIASIPFGILEQIPSTSQTTRQVHRIHDLSSEAVYASVQQANRWLGKRAREHLQRGYRHPIRDADEADRDD